MDSFKKFARMSVTDKIAELMSTLLKCGVTSSQLDSIPIFDGC